MKIKELFTKRRIGFYSLLFVGFLSLCIIRIFPNGFFISLSTFTWLLSYAILSSVSENQEEHLSVIISFTLGTTIRFFGVIGVASVDIIFLSFVSVLMLSVFFLYKLLTKKKETIFHTILFPVLWILFYLFNTLLRIPSVMRIDMMFFKFKVLLQSEYYLTSFGLSFIILFIVSLLSFAVRKKKIGSLITSVILFIIVLGLGFSRELNIKEPEFTIKTAYATGPYVGDFMNYEVPEYEKAKKSVVNSINEAGKLDAELIVFNEETIELDDTEEEDFLNAVSLSAKENEIYVLVGLDVHDTDASRNGKAENKIVFFSQEGTVLDSYEKYQTIPVLEKGYVRGKGNIPFEKISFKEGDAGVSFVICYDSNFPLYFSKLDKNTDVLLLPSWDWDGVSLFHSYLSGTLSVENRVTLFKPTYDGYMLLVNPYGRETLMKHIDEVGYEQVEVIDLPVYRRTTK